MKTKTSVKSKANPAELSNKDIVKEKYPKAECIKLKSGFCIGVKSGKEIKPIHSGIAKNESDAWKKAAHGCI
jgi:hypothetical protein